jgi:nitrilase
VPADPDEVVCRGGACIIDPLGQVIAGPLWDREGIVCAEIDLDGVTRAMLCIAAIGHYGRPDVFSLHVDARCRPAVSFDAD